MKKKLSLLLIMIMALTTLVATGGVHAYADAPVAGCTALSYSGNAHFYAYGTTFTLTDADGTANCYEGAFYEMVDGVEVVTIIGRDNQSIIVQDSGSYYNSYPAGGRVYTSTGGPLLAGRWYVNYSGTYVQYCGGTHDDPIYPTVHASTASAHEHNYQYQVITAPSTNADGLEGEVCTICGATRNIQPISAFGYALEGYALPMINAAKSGQTITFEFGELNSFPKTFMEKLVDKSAAGVTFVFKYKVNHKLQTVTIPAGTPINLDFDYYGPAKMAELYGMY